MFSPVEGAEVTTPYNKAGSLWASGRHTGVDFAAPTGSSVYAAVGGKVIDASWGGAYGNRVKVLHDDGSIGYYAHLSSFGVRPGQRVKRGTLLGKVGSTGNSTGPHLHFEIRQNGKNVNPLPWLEGSGSYDDKGSMLPSPFSGTASVQQMPDVVQHRSPEDVLAAFRSAAIGGSRGRGMNFAPASARPGLSEVVDSGGVRDWLDRESYLAAQARAVDTSATTMIHGIGQGAVGPPTYAPGTPQGGFDSLVEAIRDKESQGNYNARNPHSGALGAYQIMPNNIGPWSEAALGRRVSIQEFLSNPSIQDQIARHRLLKYYNQYGAEGAALAWYAGPGALSYSESTRNRPQGNYPSMNDYVRDVLRRAGL